MAETKLPNLGFTTKLKRQVSAKVQDFIENKLGQQQGKQDAKTGAAVKPGLAGALTIVNTNHQAIAAIADGTEVKANEDIVLSSRVIAGGIDNKALSNIASKAKDKGKPEDPNASLALSAAVVYGDYNHTATAYTGDNTYLEAKRVGINAQTIQPYAFTWHKYEGINSIIDKLKNITGDLDLSSQLTGYANARGKAEELSIAGSVNLLSFTNNTTAHTGRNSAVNILGGGSNQEWKPALPGQKFIDENGNFEAGSFQVTLESPVTIKAVTEIGGAFAAGNIGGLTKPAGVSAEPDGGSVGGAYSHPVYFNTTSAYVAEGTVIKPAAGVSPVDLAVIARSREQIISVTPTSGLGSGYGLNGMVALTGIYSTTTASIDDEAQVTARKLKIVAEDDVLAWAVGGAVTYDKALGVGFGVALNDINTETRAFIGDNDLASLGNFEGLITAEQLEVSARTDGSINALAVVGAIVSNSDPNPDGTSWKDKLKDGVKNKLTSLKNKIAPSGGSSGGGSGEGKFGQAMGKLKEVMNDAYNKLKDAGGTDKEAPKETKTADPKFGLGISGSSSVNLTGLTTRSYLDNAIVQLTSGTDKSLEVKAVNDTDIFALSGGAALTRAKAESSEFSGAVAGAVTVNDLANETSALIKNAKIRGAE